MKIHPKNKLIIFAITLLGIVACFLAIVYLRDHDPKYGPDLIADLIIPIGLPLLAFSSSLFLSRIYSFRFWQAATAFPLGFVIGIVTVSIYFSFPLSAGTLVTPIIIFIALFCFGAFGFFIGNIFFNSKESDR